MKHLILTLFLLSTITMLSAKKYTARSEADIQNIIVKTIADCSKGNFIQFITATKANEHFIEIGDVQDFKRYAASYRDNSCWMVPSIGNEISSIPIETQFLIIDRGNSEYLMMIPLVDKQTRCSIGGTKTKKIELIAETGDSLLLVNNFLGLYLLSGNNPQQMIKQASTEIQQELKTFKLRKEKHEPWFANYYGWCTYNALYGNLSKDTLVFAMENFRKRQIPVRYIIIDDGWQSNTNGLLNSFSAIKSKFPEGIGETISILKKEYGLGEVLMWQALWGTFKGLDAGSFIGNVQKTSFLPPPRMNYLLADKSNVNVVGEATVGPRFYPGFVGSDIFIPEDFYRYYNSYFNYLRKCGVDGIKLDAMTWIEATGNNAGGRVKATKQMLEGLQSATSIHFNNELINCSSCSNDYLFNTLTSNVTRTSGDFFPNRPESHGYHVFTNAHTSFWMGEIVLPDWDMFQSGHAAGAFHAASRAISGGPVYTTEEIGTEDKTILNRLMTTKGRLSRCNDVGKVCTSSLFTDPANGDKAIKIYNTNLAGGIIGAFNCSYNAEKPAVVSEEVKATDIENIQGDKFAVYCFSNNKLMVKQRKESIHVKLKELEFDLFSYVPVKDGFAPIGIVSKYNPEGMITEYNRLSNDLISLKLLEGGKFVAYSERNPAKVLIDNKPVKFTSKSNRLEIDVPQEEDVILTIIY